MAKKKKRTLLEAAKADPRSAGRVSWFELLPERTEEQRELKRELVELHQAFSTGAPISIASLFRAVQARGVLVPKNTFRDWLRRPLNYDDKAKAKR